MAAPVQHALPGRPAERTMFVSGACINPTCTARFTVLRTAAERRQAEQERLWEHTCSTACAREMVDDLLRKERQKQRLRQGPGYERLIFVSGYCRRETCRRPFTQPVTIKYLLASPPDSMPSTCSPQCKESVRRKKRKGRPPAPFVPPSPPKPKSPPVAPKTCPACWVSTVDDVAYPLCHDCMITVRNSCKGKIRRGTEHNATRAAGQRGSWAGINLDLYECPVCGWWHIGGEIPAKHQKRVQFTARMFVARADRELVERLRIEYAPKTSLKKIPRAPSGRRR